MSSFRDVFRKIDIVDVISSYIELKRVGNNFVARCPFHPDDTPSFYVSPSKGIFKCFGCGVGGDAVKFVSLYENISYMEALEKLARKYNIPFRLERREKNSKVLLALQRVADFYWQELRENKRALEYLRSRGLSSNTINRFQLGFAGNTDKLIDLLKEEGLLEFYEKTGNITKIEGQIYRDFFKNRITIPIKDIQGNVIAFGGRSIDGAQPKYVNSPESEVFKKRVTLFGLYEARDYIKEEGEAIIVEGYFDLLSLWQEGIRNCIAPLGTALTEEHVRILSKFTKKVLLLYDGDSAGKKAVKSSAPYLLKAGIKVRVACLPEGEDPDSFVKKEPKSLRALMSSAKELEVEYMQKVKEGNGEALEELIYFCSFIPDDVKRYELLKELSKATGIALSTLRSRLLKVEKKVEKEDMHLTYLEAILLAGLYRFGFEDVKIENLKLSPQALELAQAIQRKDYHLLPDYIKNYESSELRKAFEDSIRALSLPQMERPENFQKFREKSKAQPRKIRKR